MSIKTHSDSELAFLKWLREQGGKAPRHKCNSDSRWTQRTIDRLHDEGHIRLYKEPKTNILHFSLKEAQP